MSVPPDTPPRFTIGIVSYNAREFLGRCLRSVLREARAVPSEVVVIDNASADGSAALVRERFPEIRLIESGENLGYGRGANRAFAEGAGSWFLLLNSDIELEEGCLSSLALFLEKRPRVGVVGGQLLESDGSIQRSCFSFPSLAGYFFEATSLYRFFPRDKTIGDYYLGSMDYEEEAEVDVPLGAFLAVRREVWEKLGGMDERFFMYSEETDFCRRAKDKGWEIRYTPECRAVHHGAKSTRIAPARMFAENHRSKVRYMRIHEGPVRAFLARLILLLGVIPRLACWSFFRVLASPSRRPEAGKRVRMFAAAAAVHLGLFPRPKRKGAAVRSGDAA